MANGDKYRNRYTIILTFFILGAVVILYKSAQLQLIDDTFSKRAKSTTIDRQTLYPSRGLIYDRNGKLMVYNNAIYDIEVIVDNIDPQMDTALFCDLLNIDKATFKEKLDKNWDDIRYAPNVPFTFLKKIPPKQFASFSEILYKFPGFIPRLRNVRGYTYPNAAHVLGYISEVNNEVLQDSGDIYSPGDYIGTTGMEKYYENILRGEKGMQYVLKDKWGHQVGILDEERLDTSAISGKNITISLDIKLQKYLEKLMENKIGAAVAIEPKSGEILSLVSSPTYNPNLLTVNRDRGKAFNELNTDTLKPFFNRAISARYSPGSTFKPFLALVGLQENTISPDELNVCNGGYFYKTYSWGCHAGGGAHDVTSAIQVSCNTYFYKLYRKLIDRYGFNNPGKGLKNLNKYLNEMGLGHKLGVDLPNESSGLIPGVEYYDELYSNQRAEWRSTYIISNGIGQGEIQVTTLQLANLAVLMANRGWYKTPHFLKNYRNSSLPLPKRLTKKHNLDVDSRFYKPVIEGLRRAVQNGTGGMARIPGIKVAGKTGTSENSHGEDHSVFFAFAPMDNPKIAIAVYVENAGFGSAYAAPIAGLGIEKYLNDTIADSKKWIEKRMLNSNLVDKTLASIK